MGVDEREFFREATLRMCSSLAIEKAMSLCVQYITQFIPVDTLFFNLYEYDLGAMRTIAAATSSGGKRLDRVTYLPDEARAYLDEKRRVFFEQGPSGKVIILNYPEHDPASVPMVEDFGIPDASLLILPLTPDQVMGRHIRNVLKMTGGKVEGPGGAAELLGLNPGTLRHRMRKLGIPFGRNVKTG